MNNRCNDCGQFVTNSQGELCNKCYSKISILWSKFYKSLFTKSQLT